MTFKLTTVGVLIYAAMLGYLAAFATLVTGRKRTGRLIYGGAFVAAAAAFGFRWHGAGHVPLQSMFEVFLCLGMLSFPLSEFCRRCLDTRGGAADALIGFLVLFPAGLVFSGEPRQLPPALQSAFFVPHVMAYMLAYVILFKAGVQALGQLFARDTRDERRAYWETAAYRTVRLGFPVLTLGLLLGACWGKVAWGDYWNWDPKELWSLATWLMYVGYLHFRSAHGRKYARVNCGFLLTGTVFIVLTLLWVNLAGKLFGGLHTYGVS